MAQTAAPTMTAISRQVSRIGSRTHIRTSLAVTAPVGVRGSADQRPGRPPPARTGRADASIRRLKTAGHHSAAAAVSTTRPASDPKTASQSPRAAACTATGPQPVGSHLSAFASHGTEPRRSAVSSAGSNVAATATTLSATAVTIVPTSCPRREPGPSTAPAIVDSTLASASDKMTAATATAVGAAPRPAARAMSAANAIAMNAPAGSSSPTISRERASRRRSSGSRLNSSGRSTASPASALCATRPPTQSKNTSASTSVAAAWLG